MELSSALYQAVRGRNRGKLMEQARNGRICLANLSPLKTSSITHIRKCILLSFFPPLLRCEDFGSKKNSKGEKEQTPTLERRQSSYFICTDVSPVSMDVTEGLLRCPAESIFGREH